MEISALTTDKVPPQNMQAEMSVLGCMLMDRYAVDRTIEELDSESFYASAHQTIFSAMLTLYKNNRPIDPVTLVNALTEAGTLDQVGGAVYLTELVDMVPTTAHIDTYIKIVAQKYLARELIAASTETVKECYELQEDSEELLDHVQSRIFELAEKRIGKSFQPAVSLVKGVVDKLEKLHDDSHYATGVPSGFYDLDEITSGFQRSDLIVIASRPSMGKTALALSIAQHIAVTEKKGAPPIPIVIFSIEMSSEQLIQRMICSLAEIDAQRVRKGKFTNSEWVRITTAADRLAKAPIYINDTPGISALQIRAIARRLRSTYGIELVIVDYIQLMQGSTRRYDNRQQEISEISRLLKGLARELNIPVLALSQLNRDVESRPGRKPQLSDLRESGAIEQDADVVILLMRPDYYDEDIRPGEADLFIAKQRNGPTGYVTLTFLKDITRFVPLSRQSVTVPGGEEADFDFGENIT